MAMATKHEEIGILLVEDDPLDLEMTMRALKGDHVKNRIDSRRGGSPGFSVLPGILP